MDEMKISDSFTYYRFPCNCYEPEHSLDLCVERHKGGDVVSVGVEMRMMRDTPLKDRIHDALAILFNKRVILSETILRPEDWGEFTKAADWILKASETTSTS